ncbi:MAG: DUF421 domain-containing protein [Eubacteriales bacterium]
MIAIFFRALIIYITLMLTLRFMGKRQVGELEMSDLIGSLLLSEIAAMPIDDPDIPLLYALIPILFIMSMEIIITFSKTKLNFLKKIFESHPIFIIEQGVIREDQMRRMRISVEELLSECRQQGVVNLSDVRYAILEQNGKFSIIPNASKAPATPADLGIKSVDVGIMHSVILDGTIEKNALAKTGYTETQLHELCARYRCAVGDIFVLGIDDLGHITVVKKKTEREDT